MYVCNSTRRSFYAPVWVGFEGSDLTFPPIQNCLENRLEEEGHRPRTTVVICLSRRPLAASLPLYRADGVGPNQVLYINIAGCSDVQRTETKQKQHLPRLTRFLVDIFQRAVCKTPTPQSFLQVSAISPCIVSVSQCELDVHRCSS